jgi:hypothetical protein
MVGPNVLGKREWEAVESTGKAPTSRCNASAVVIEGSMLVFAGHSGVATNADLYDYNFGTKLHHCLACRVLILARWWCGRVSCYASTCCASLLTPAPICVCPQRIASRTWSQIECSGDAPSKRLGHTSVCNQDHMYMFGGTDWASATRHDATRHTRHRTRTPHATPHTRTQHRARKH